MLDSTPSCIASLFGGDWYLYDALHLQQKSFIIYNCAMQISGLVLFSLGFTIAWLFLPGLGNGVPTGGLVGRGHQTSGTLVMCLAVIQVSALPRKPSEVLVRSVMGAIVRWWIYTTVWGSSLPRSFVLAMPISVVSAA